MKDLGIKILVLKFEEDLGMENLGVKDLHTGIDFLEDLVLEYCSHFQHHEILTNLYTTVHNFQNPLSI